MTKYKPITDRVAEWNAKRYDRVYNFELARSLLLEEIDELQSAVTVTDKLDAIGDIVFVAIGVLWKMGFDKKQLMEIFYLHNIRQITAHDAYAWTLTVESAAFDMIDHETEGSYPGLALALTSVFIIALGSLRGLGLQQAFYDIVHAICDSNDTKVVEGRTAANVKANIVKGLGYVPPTARLLEIYGQYCKKGIMH